MVGSARGYPTYNEAVKANIAHRLIELNREFYQKHARSFSATRGRLQPGVQITLEGVPGDASVLDLGCGNGGVARELQSRGHTGRYVGVDFSEELLEDARNGVRNSGTFQFVKAELSEFSHQLSALSTQQFEFIFCFASLHHIPTEEMRLAFLSQVGEWLTPAGKFTLSVWQFLASERLRERILPWEEAGLADDVVDTGDYLLDWRSGGEGLRYVHAFDEAELAELAAKAGFKAEATFYSDGLGGKLGLYQTWIFNSNHRPGDRGGVSA
jgi:tRNA (uracil-5-)-methyltransferase TRM9